MKNRLLAAAVLAGCALLMTGCGEKGKNHLEIFSTKMENQAILQSFIDDYTQEHPGVTIEFNSPPDASTVLRTKLTKNRVPDIIFMGGDMTFRDMSEAEILMDLSDMEEAGRIKEAVKEQVYNLNPDQEEKLFGLPYATNAEGIIYNVDIFNEQGLEIPKTWDELMDVCGKLESAGIQPFYFTLKDSWTGGPLWIPMTYDLAGMDFFLDRREGKTTFLGTHEEAAEKILTLTQYGQKDLLGKGYDDGNIDFANGKAAMMFQGNWAIPNIQKANPDVNLDMFALPVTNDESKNAIISGIDVMPTIYKDTKEEELAKDFISFIFQDEKVKAYIEDQFAFPSVDTVVQDNASVAGVAEKFADDNIGDFADHYYPTGFDFTVTLQTFVGSRGDVEEFLKKLDKEYDKYNSF